MTPRSQNLGGAIGVAVASSIAASRFHTLVHHGLSSSAALTGGFQMAVLVCGLTGLLAVPAAVVFIRRTEHPNAVSIPQGRDLALAIINE